MIQKSFITPTIEKKDNINKKNDIIKWNDTTIGQYVKNDTLYRINLFAMTYQIQLSDYRRQEKSIFNLYNHDFITCFHYDEILNYQFMTTFHNNLYIVNDKNHSFLFSSIVPFTIGKYIHKMKIYYENNEGPLLILFQLIEGEFLLVKLTIMEQIKIIYSYKIKLGIHIQYILDYVILNDETVFFLVQQLPNIDNKKSILRFDLKTFEIQTQIFHHSSYIQLYTKENTLYVYDIKNMKWKILNYQSLFQKKEKLLE